jgi:hypothetical protein
MDEHIRDLTLRCAQANPTLKIMIFAYDVAAKLDLEGLLKPEDSPNSNVIIIAPDQKNEAGNMVDAFSFDVSKVIEEYFGKLPDCRYPPPEPPVSIVI